MMGRIQFMACLAVGIASGVCPAIARAGSLTPPAGPVAPTPGPEPRTPINASNTPGDADSLFKITAPGSYYLAGNVTGAIGKHGIEIAASAVTIDLMGFEARGVAGSFHGIAVSVSSLSGITVRNGVVRDWGRTGVELSQSSPSLIRVVDVSAINNTFSGIIVGSSAEVRGCQASGNLEDGMQATNTAVFTSCTAYDNGRDGINARFASAVLQCTSYANSASGFMADDSTTFSACTARGNIGCGFLVEDHCLIEACVATANGDAGIRVRSQSTVRDNVCHGELGVGEAGVSVTGDYNVIEGNSCSGTTRGIDIDAGADNNTIDSNRITDNDIGLDIDGVNNLVIRNTASGSTPNYSIVAGNSVAPRVSVTASDGWAGITNANHPWANLGY